MERDFRVCCLTRVLIECGFALGLVFKSSTFLLNLFWVCDSLQWPPFTAIIPVDFLAQHAISLIAKGTASDDS
jgi:hypothetical protein